MALPASDNFNRANGGVGANWTALQNNGDSAFGHAILSNQLIAAAGDQCFSVWNADVFTNDHSSQITAVNTNGYAGLGVRFPASGPVTGYVWRFHDGFLYRVDNGNFTAIAGPFSIPADGSVCTLTATGSSIECFDDGVSLGSAIDATYASGSPGVYGFDNIPQALSDDWVGDNIPATIVGGGVPLLPFRTTISARRS